MDEAMQKIVNLTKAREYVQAIKVLSEEWGSALNAWGLCQRSFCFAKENDYENALKDYVKCYQVATDDDVDTLFPQLNETQKILQTAAENGQLLYAEESKEYVHRCIGALLGKAMGDALGSECEFKSAKEIIQVYGIQGIRELEGTEKYPARYTDDTEMAVAMTVSIGSENGICARKVAMAYAYTFMQPPRRGYGPSASKLLSSLAMGFTTYKDSGRLGFSEGSYANGSVMRIAPIALCFRNAPDNVILDAVIAAVMCTHVHPEAVDAAFCQTNPENLNVSEVMELAIQNARTSILRKKLEAVKRELESQGEYAIDRSGQSLDERQADHDKDMKFLKTIVEPNMFSEFFQIRASEAMACVIYGFCKYFKDPVDCLIRTITYGGDADTTAAILGALLGSLYGYSWICSGWFSKLENDHLLGRDGIINLAIELADKDFTSHNNIYNLPSYVVKW